MSGPEGTPNGVDRLAEIKSRRAVNLEDGIYVRMSIWERETLVEIGQAARVVERKCANAPWFREYYRVNELAEALNKIVAPGAYRAPDEADESSTRTNGLTGGASGEPEGGGHDSTLARLDSEAAE